MSRRESALVPDGAEADKVAMREFAGVRDGALFETAFRKSSDLIMIARLEDSTLMEVNDAFLRMTGYERGDVIGRSVFELDLWASPADRAALMEGMRRGPSPAGLTTRFRTPSGRVREMLLSVDVVEVGVERCTVSIGRDITLQRREKETRARLSAIVDSTDDAIVGKTLRGTIFAWNRGAERMYGFSVDEAIGRPVSIIVPPDRMNELASIMQRVGRGESVPAFDTVRVRKDGKRIEVSLSISPIRDEGGHLIAASAIGRDVTDRRLSERRLKEGEERYRSLVEACPDAVVVTDTNFKLTMANARALELLGAEDEFQLVGHGGFDFVVPEEWEQAALMTREVLDKGAVSGVELTLVRADGTRFTGEVSASVSNDTTRGPSLVSVVRDVTARRREQDEISEAFRREREAVERLVALDQMRNTFLQAVSHELRTPLASIVGMAVTLERDELRPNEAQTREFARLIAVNAKKLESMVTDLLDVERLERGILEPRRSGTDIGELIRRIASGFEPLSGREVHLEVPSLFVEIDVPKVERIVENLLSNAARHTPPAARIWVKVREHENGVLLTVEDDGPGIAPGVREQVFEPFGRGNVVHDEAPGLGIGLSLVARFAELHGGRAWVEERPGGGAAFRVYLPGASSADRD